jgi:hypothetical protein
MMLNLSMLLFGCALGFRFKVLVLLPAIGLVWMAYLTVGIARSEGVSAILIGGMLQAFCLQFGYLVGAMVLHGSLTSRAIKIPRSVFPAGKLR